MLKYSVEFKLGVVQEYETGPQGLKSIAKRHGLDHGMIRRWVIWHRAHGQEGLDKKYSHYSASFKLSVLQHMWAGGLSFSQVAVLFNIRNAAAVANWDRHWRSGGLDALKSRARGRPRKMQTSPPPLPPASSSDDEKRSREELAAELNRLRMENAYLKKLQALVQAPRKSAALKKRK